MTTDVSAEARWRNYQHLIWTQQQIHLQIQQQQQLQNANKDHGDVDVRQVDTSGLGTVVPNVSGQNEISEKLADEKAKEIIDPWDTLDAHCAFLGPTLWDKRLPYDGQDFKLEYMELEDFLTENGIPVETPVPEIFAVERGIKSGSMQQQQECHPPVDTGVNPLFSVSSQFMAGPSRGSNNPGVSHNMRTMSTANKQKSSRSSSPTGSSRSSSSSRQDMNHFVASPDSSQSSAEMVLLSIPGHDFDPRTRAFTDDELKPQPMIKKSKKQLVPDEQKDAKYWSRRRKNNFAAKRSRDARRVKENQIAMRAGFLEKENQAFKDQLEKIRDELKRSNNEIIMLKGQLSHCHREH